MWQLIAGIALGWLFTLSGVITGGYLVFHTKRDPYDPFMKVREPKGEVFSLDEFDTPAEEPEPIEPLLREQNDRFQGLFANLDERVATVEETQGAFEAAKAAEGAAKRG